MLPNLAANLKDASSWINVMKKSVYSLVFMEEAVEGLETDKKIGGALTVLVARHFAARRMNPIAAKSPVGALWC